MFGGKKRKPINLKNKQLVIFDSDQTQAIQAEMGRKAKSPRSKLRCGTLAS